MRKLFAPVLWMMLASALAVALAEAQQPGKNYRVGYLSAGVESGRRPLIEAFRQGMRELGYVEGQNLTIETRFADGKFDRLPALADEFLRLKPDVLLVSTTPANVAAKKAITAIPIVMVAVADPVGVGLVASLARPGGNITGVTNIIADLAGKRLEILKEIIPMTAKVAVMVNPDNPNAKPQMSNAAGAAKILKIDLDPVVHVRSASDLKGAFETVTKARAKAILRMVDPLVTALRQETAELALKNRIALVSTFAEDVAAGSLFAYGTNLPEQYRQAAKFVHKILQGTKPADIPVEQPTKFELVINLKTAKQIGVTIPPNVLARADKVIK